jgi:conjugative transfer pilus assembly protein TraH
MTPRSVPLTRRLIVGLLSVTLAVTPIAALPADLNTEMQSMFNDLGALGNVTSPGAFRGQAMNLYTGGSLMMRAGSQLPLVNAQLPSLRAGCGGIDIYGGAFRSSTSSSSLPCCRTSAPTPWATPSSWPCSRSRPTSTSCSPSCRTR